jgi:hypothetical protein
MDDVAPRHLQPILVHLIFHPQSSSARELARHIHRQLNDDVVVPGLRVPTMFCPVGEGGHPPEALHLDAAALSFVVALADDDLAVDDDWCRFVADIWLACQTSPHRCVPMQLSANAWPLDDRLHGVNFGRAFAQPEGERNAWTARRIVIELCRCLSGMAISDDHSRAPIKLFLSHAKCDIATHPKVTQALVDYLKADQPVDAWVDSGEIETGSKFAEDIAAGIQCTSLLAILTDNYSSREWCREEIMLAKEHQRPIAVIDALTSHEVRSFPFLENVPKLRWNDSAEQCVDLLLKETLRHLHTRAVLEQFKRPGDTVFLRPPEPATLLGVAPGSVILYPDPPLGVGELKRLSKTNLPFTTPLQRSGEKRSLAGKLVALSMSESTDIARHGQDGLHLEQTMLELSRHLLIRGASLAYGGHIGSDGYTQRLFELVRTHNDRKDVEPFQRIVNHRGWPLPKLPKSKLAELIPVSTLIPIARPMDVDESLNPVFVPEPEVYFPADPSAEHRYAWCRGMTEMRALQADHSRSKVIARVVLGGTFGPTLKAGEEGQPAKQQWYAGRMPGVLEEVLLSLQAGQPVFLIGAFGGAAKLVIDLLLGRSHAAARWDFQSHAPFAEAARALYALRAQKWWYYDDEVRVDGLPVDDSRSIREFLAQAWQPRADRGWETGINPLPAAQNMELFETVDVSRIVELLHHGLSLATR